MLMSMLMLMLMSVLMLMLSLLLMWYLHSSDGWHCLKVDEAGGIGGNVEPLREDAVAVLAGAWMALLSISIVSKCIDPFWLG